MLIRFELPIEVLSKSIITPINIVKFFYGIFLNCKNQQNSFNCQIILDFHYGKLYSFCSHGYKNS